MKVKLNRYRPVHALDLRVADVPTIYRHSAKEGSKFISPMRRPAFPHGNIPGTDFC